MKKLLPLLLSLSLILLTTECKVSNMEPVETVNLDTNRQDVVNMKLSEDSKYELSDNVYILDLADKNNKIKKYENGVIIFEGKPNLVSAKQLKNGRISGDSKEVSKEMVIQIKKSNDSLSLELKFSKGITIKITNDPTEVVNINGKVELVATFTVAEIGDIFNYIDITGSIKMTGTLVASYGYLGNSETNQIYYSGQKLSTFIATCKYTGTISYAIEPQLRLVWTRENGVNVFNLQSKFNFTFSNELNVELIAKLTREFLILNKQLPPLAVPIGPFVIPVKQRFEVFLSPMFEGKVTINQKFLELTTTDSVGVLYNRANTVPIRRIAKGSTSGALSSNATLALAGKCGFELKPQLVWSPPTLEDAKEVLKTLGLPTSSANGDEFSLIDLNVKAGVKLNFEASVTCENVTSNNMSSKYGVEAKISPFQETNLKVFGKEILNAKVPESDISYALGFEDARIARFLKEHIPCNPVNINELTLDSFRELLRMQGFPIFDGVTLPNVNGEYISNPHELVKSTYLNDSSLLKKAFGDLKIYFEFGRNRQLVETYQYNRSDVYISDESANSDIKFTGDGENFTILAITKGAILLDPSNEFVNYIAISGKKTAMGIKDFHYAMYRQKNLKNSQGNLPLYTIRILKDSDGLASQI